MKANPWPPKSSPVGNLKRPTTGILLTPDGVANRTRSPSRMSLASAQLS